MLSYKSSMYFENNVHYCLKVYVTTTTLNGKLEGLDVEEASEKQCKLLEAFSSWVISHEKDGDDEMLDKDFLFTFVSLFVVFLRTYN